VAGAILGLPLGASTISQWLEPVFHPALEAAGVTEQPYAIAGIDGFLIIVSVAVATIGMVAAWRLFGFGGFFGFFRIHARLDRVRELTARVPRLYLGSFNKWYFDELNHLLFVEVGGKVANGAAWFDVHVIDGVVNGIASVTQKLGDDVRQVQTGRVQNYALGIAIGLILVAISIIFLTTR
jgi:NADH-quinone oxidoreductase subunit L